MSNDIPVLKFNFIKEKLDYKGNLVKDIQVRECKWLTYNPEKIITMTLEEKDLSALRAPLDHKGIEEFLSCFASDLMKTRTPYGIYWNPWEVYTKIESEPFNSLKFVAYDGIRNIRMKWEWEDKENN